MQFYDIVQMSRSMEEAATGLQLSFEETVNESYNLYQTATKGDSLNGFYLTVD